MNEAVVAIVDHRDLMVMRMTTGDDRAHARDYLLVAVEQLDLAANRRDDLACVTIRCSEPLVRRLIGNIEFAPLHVDSRACERGFEHTRLAPAHQSAAVIEVEMRRDDVRDVAQLHPKSAQLIYEPAVLVREDFSFDIAQPIADPGIHQDRVAAAHDKRAREVEPDTVLHVGRIVALPQFAGNHAEHASTIITPKSVAQECNSKFTDLNFWRRFGHGAILAPRSASHEP